MKKSKLLIVLIIVNLQTLFAQIPHLTGEVKISILNGTIESNLEYSNLPSLNNYSIWLNSGLNIRYFRNAEENFNYSFKKEYLTFSVRATMIKTFSHSDDFFIVVMKKENGTDNKFEVLIMPKLTTSAKV